MRTLDLIVVADRHCPTSRTYLRYLRNAGLRPRKVIVVDFLWDDAAATRLQRKWGSWIGSQLLQARKAGAPQHSSEFARACRALQTLAEVPVDYFSEFDFASHADEMVVFTATDFDDVGLHRRLGRERCRTFLYTNGGRVPATLLTRDDMRFIHVHPGVVPDVRGSDGLLWSLLLRGRPGASCFYMDAGIDTGSVIGHKEFPWPDLRSIARELPASDDVLYQALVHAYDPHLRASLLVDVLSAADDPGALAATRQRPDDGQAYCWMHPRLRRKVLRRLVTGAPSQ